MTGSLTLPSLRCSSNVSQEFRDMIRFEPGLLYRSHPRALTKYFLGYDGSTIHQWMPCCPSHWWNEDVTAFETELNRLKNSAEDPDGSIVSAHLARKKEGVIAITEVSFTCVDIKSFLIIVYSMPASVQHGRRTAMRTVPPNYLTPGPSALKSRRHIPPLVSWLTQILTVSKSGSSSSATQRKM